MRCRRRPTAGFDRGSVDVRRPTTRPRMTSELGQHPTSTTTDPTSPVGLQPPLPTVDVDVRHNRCPRFGRTAAALVLGWRGKSSASGVAAVLCTLADQWCRASSMGGMGDGPRDQIRWRPCPCADWCTGGQALLAGDPRRRVGRRGCGGAAADDNCGQRSLAGPGWVSAPTRSPPAASRRKTLPFTPFSMRPGEVKATATGIARLRDCRAPLARDGRGPANTCRRIRAPACMATCTSPAK